MKNNKGLLDFRTKAEVILIAALFAGIAMNSVLSGTVTITDKTMTTTDSSAEINWEDGWSRWDNATIDNESVNKSVINQWNLGYTYRGGYFFNVSPAFGITAALINQWNLAYLYRGDQTFNESKAATITNDMMLGWNASNNTFIRNSKDNSWAATGANIQLAIDDVGENGTVWFPDDVFGLYTTQWVNNSNVSLIGTSKTEFKAMTYLPTNGMLRINSADDVLVKGIVFNGNNNYPAESAAGRGHGVFLNDVSRFRITECTIFNTSGSGLECYRINDSMIDHNYIHHTGNISVGGQQGTGIRFSSSNWGCHNNTISYNLIEDVMEHGIKIYNASSTYPSAGAAGEANRNRSLHNKVCYNTIKRSGFLKIVTPSGTGQCIDLLAPGNDAIGNTIFIGKYSNNGIVVGACNNTVTNNRITFENDSASAGIYVVQGHRMADFNKIVGNTITGVVLNPVYGNSGNNSGIVINGGQHNLVSLNVITGCKNTIVLQQNSVTKACKYNIVTNNICSGYAFYLSENLSPDGIVADNTIAFNDFTDLKRTFGEGIVDYSGAIVPGDNNFTNNQGYTTESIGVATIPIGSASLVVNHNMSTTPLIILVTPRGNISAAGATYWYVDTLTSTQFTIHVGADLEAAIAFYWKAE